MEKLEENFFKDLLAKIKGIRPKQSPQDDYTLTPEQEMMEEIVGYLQIELHDLKLRMQAALGDTEAALSDTNRKYNKMESVSRLIRDILASIKNYKRQTSSISKVSDQIYSTSVEKLHNISEDTPLIEYEKVLIQIAKDMMKLADMRSHEIEGSDEEDSAFDHYFRLFKMFPTKDFKLLLDIEGGFEKTKDHANLRKDYETTMKKIFDKTKTKATSLSLNKADEYNNEWTNDSDSYKFNKFLDERLFTDFNRLWDEKFKHMWREKHTKDMESERQKIAHIKETLLKEFTRE